MAFFVTQLHICDLEAAINHWRERRPSPKTIDLGPELNALATIYAEMVISKAVWVDEQAVSDSAMKAWLAWYDTTPDTPCIAICSTSQGDAVCKGCGRLFEEVQRWPAMSPSQKRITWRRISQEGTALRFTRYAERGAPSPGAQALNGAEK